jgi:hypothetical protein
MNVFQSIKRVCTLGNRHPRPVAYIRVACGVWLVFLTVALYGSGHGGQWAWLLAVTAVLHFGLAYRLFRIARNQPGGPVAI